MSELESYLDMLYGNDTGYVYSPTKSPEWTPYFFRWPYQRKQLIRHVRSRSRSEEVYIGPALYGSREITPESFISSRSVWTEFDGNLPKSLKGLPEPTYKIQSSDPGHEHWYWVLDEPIQDVSLLELVLKKIAYTLDADKSVRDYQQVLRPPTTIHHDTGKVVSRKGEIGDPTAVEDFAHIEEPETTSVAISDSEVKNVDIEWAVALYEWDVDTFDLFQKPEIPEGQRSSALTRLAFSCSEMGMSDVEIAAILLHADNRWHKYSGRDDQLKRLEGIITHVRTKKISKSESSESASTALGFEDFLRVEIKIDWIVKGLIPTAGQAVVFGEAGCGKTTLGLRTAMAIAKGQNYLSWEVAKKKRVLFLSAEMPHEELNEFFKDMAIGDTSSLQENFFIYPLGHGFPLNNKRNQATLLELIDMHKIEVLIIDSLSVVAGGSTNDDKVMVSLNEWVDKNIRIKRRCAVVYIHHARKPDKLATTSAKTLADVYGSIYISTNSLTVIGMERTKKDGHPDTATLYYAKGRYLPDIKTRLLCTDNRDFIIGRHSDSEDSDEKPRTRRKDSSKNPGSKAGPADLFGGMAIK